MGKINVGKVIVGGIVAGIVMNGLDYVINEMLLKDMMTATLQARNIDPAALSIPTMVALDFAMALLLVFTYAAIRPRFGAGPKTAIVAGLLLALVTSTLAAYFVGMGFFTWNDWMPNAALSTINLCVSALAGCALYKE
ncbi:MAG: hypothetical protein EPO35_00310 [Acidobacteria bacterium]|nr:MAG: hypothetical protein EPO35_00310 [Acidobacteriota bacterium]